MDCPNPTCHEEIVKEFETMKRYIDKKISWKALSATIGFIIVLGLAGLGAWGRAADQRNTNKQSIAVEKKEREKDMEYIKRSITKIENQQLSPEKMAEIIRQAISQEMKEKRNNP